MLYRLISIAIYALIVVSAVRGLNHAFNKIYSTVKINIEQSYAQAESEYNKAVAESEGQLVSY